ncbi:DUF5615 family PIN-like protein [Egbenema bharatensis]|uniref:DUF5615 family PIN-like protein n=1 Tax=Egbenema bharatensis TaxID=3463334 RepID=UPI003A874A7B
MPRTIRCQLDENVTIAIADGLRRRGIDVKTTQELGLMGATDEEHLVVANSQHRVIFTQDDDFLRLHDAKFNHAGIVYCQQQRRSIGEIIKGLILIWEWLEPEEMENHVEFL